MKRVYLDNAATTPLRPEVIEAMLPFLHEHFGNPSSIHAEGRKVRASIETARKVVAQSIHASIGEIFFTSGGTEANNMALRCSVRDLGVKRIISSPIEHHCILHTLAGIQQENTVKTEYLHVDREGRIDPEELRKKLRASSEKTLVSLMHANNEIGTMIDLDLVSAICSEEGALFHSDTVQTISHFPIDVSKTRINFLACGAHKFHGPKGCGFIYINQNTMVHPFIEGGGQERNMRGGTENVYGIVGTAAAMQLMKARLDEDIAHIRALRSTFRQRLTEEFDDITFNGDIDGNASYTVLSVSFPATERSDMLLLSLDIAGISASGGSACSSGAETQSHVLEAIGANPKRKTIRFSFSALNTMDEIHYTIEKLKEIVPVEAHA
ncbi:MAG TPA: cysteine desulfurase family protein [Saprospiraceae bacterium]|nr:cysteine desulfurase family protein [Saprospiraceae bacterium]